MPHAETPSPSPTSSTSSPPIKAGDGPVVVTGANGFIASHTIAVLLRAGYRVIGTVRSQAKADAVQATHRDLFPNTADQQLTTAVIPDITSTAAYETLFRRTAPRAVLHLASPFAYTVRDFEADLLRPAVQGTAAVLAAVASSAPAVTRVVHTNSFACIYDPSRGPRPGYTYTAAKDWSPLTYAAGVAAPDAPTAYRASKAVAEQTAWNWMKTTTTKRAPPSFDLVSLCPAMVFGPFLDSPHAMPSDVVGTALNASNKLVWEVLSAGLDSAMPPTKGPVWIDVRDVADAHVAALSLALQPSNLSDLSGGGGRCSRLMLAKGVYCTQEIADVAREVLPPAVAAKRIPLGTPGKREKDAHFGVDASIEEKLLVGKTGGKWRELSETLAELAPQLYRIEAEAAARRQRRQAENELGETC